MDGGLVRVGFICGLLLMLAACGPQATPFPVQPVALEGTDDALIPPAVITEQPPLRHGFAENTEGFTPTLAAPGTITEVIAGPLNPQTIAAYDVVTAYGIYAEWQQSPVTSRTVLLLDTTLPPLNDPAIAAIIRQIPDPASIPPAVGIPGAEAARPPREETNRQLREAFANAGRPDGVMLRVAGSIPGGDVLHTQFGAAGVTIEHIDTSTSDPTPPFHLRLALWHDQRVRDTWDEQYGAENVIDLYSLPISYKAAPEVQVAFTDDGWPIVAR